LEGVLVTSTDHRTPDPSSVPPLELLLDFIGDQRPEDLEVWREFAGMLDAEGILDKLSNHDARHAVGAIMVDVVEHGPDGLRKRADWIDSGSGASVLQDPAKVSEALRRVADLLDIPAGADWLDGPEGQS
jgi:hypothetical protein